MKSKEEQDQIFLQTNIRIMEKERDKLLKILQRPFDPKYYPDNAILAQDIVIYTDKIRKLNDSIGYLTRNYL